MWLLAPRRQGRGSAAPRQNLRARRRATSAQPPQIWEGRRLRLALDRCRWLNRFRGRCGHNCCPLAAAAAAPVHEVGVGRMGHSDAAPVDSGGGVVKARPRRSEDVWDLCLEAVSAI